MWLITEIMYIHLWIAHFDCSHSWCHSSTSTFTDPNDALCGSNSLFRWKDGGVVMLWLALLRWRGGTLQGWMKSLLSCRTQSSCRSRNVTCSLAPSSFSLRKVMACACVPFFITINMAFLYWIYLPLLCQGCFCTGLQAVVKLWSPKQPPRPRGASSSTCRPPHWQTSGTANRRSSPPLSFPWLLRSSPASSS